MGKRCLWTWGLSVMVLAVLGGCTVDTSRELPAATPTMPPSEIIGDYLFRPTEPPPEVTIVPEEALIKGLTERDQSLTTAAQVTARLGYAENVEARFDAGQQEPLTQLRNHPGLVWLIQFDGIFIPQRGGRGGGARTSWYVLVDATTGIQLVGFTDPTRAPPGS